MNMFKKFLNSYLRIEKQKYVDTSLIKSNILKLGIKVQCIF